MIAVVGAFSHFYSNKFTALLHSKFMSFFYRIFFSTIVVVFRRRRRCNSTWFTRCYDNYFQYSHLFLCFVLFFVFFLIATNFFRNINALNEIKKNTTRFSIQQCRTRLSFFCYTFTTIDYHWLTLLFIPFPKIYTENNTHTHSISQRRSFFFALTLR